MAAVANEVTDISIPSATLPVSTADGPILVSEAGVKFGERFSAAYNAAQPFPHIVLDDFLPRELVEGALVHFPTDTPKTHDTVFQGSRFEHGKRQISPEDCDRFVRELFGFFNSAAMLNFLTALTGIKGLIADSHFEGGGFHEISAGGKLGLHADFRINRRLSVQRRLNLLIYLNKDWDEAYNGHLELWDRSAKRRVRRVAPLFNRCVIFNTERDSFHGHPDPLNTPAGVSRKSIALYYYTASDHVFLETPPKGTVFVARPRDDSSTKLSAQKLHLTQWLRLAPQELLPPVLYRRLRRLKARMKAGNA